MALRGAELPSVPSRVPEARPGEPNPPGAPKGDIRRSGWILVLIGVVLVLLAAVLLLL